MFTLTKESTAQEVFDYVADHLLKQGERSLTPTQGCLYRGGRGLSCAVGCLIPDHIYDVNMEGITAGPLLSSKLFHGQPATPEQLSFFNLMLPHGALLARLQGIHDRPVRVDNAVSADRQILIAAWIQRLTGLAGDFGLQCNFTAQETK